MSAQPATGPIAGTLEALAVRIDRLTRSIGRVMAWCALFLVLVQAGIVLMRYAFGSGSVFAQEAVLYLHGGLILLGAAATLSRDGHVRLDLLYRDFTARRKALVDLTGALALLLPVAVALWVTAWPYVANAWAALEGSPEVSGIPARFLLKSAILGFAGLMALQGLALVIRSTLILGGIDPRPGSRECGP